MPQEHRAQWEAPVGLPRGSLWHLDALLESCVAPGSHFFPPCLSQFHPKAYDCPDSQTGQCSLSNSLACLTLPSGGLLALSQECQLLMDRLPEEVIRGPEGVTETTKL